jgi:hypothetical protein
MYDYLFSALSSLISSPAAQEVFLSCFLLLEETTALLLDDSKNRLRENSLFKFDTSLIPPSPPPGASTLYITCMF